MTQYANTKLFPIMMSNVIVCPAVLRKRIFTVVAALDSIDHNPSTVIKGSFQKTGNVIPYEATSREIPMCLPTLS